MIKIHPDVSVILFRSSAQFLGKADSPLLIEDISYAYICIKLFYIILTYYIDLSPALV